MRQQRGMSRRARPATGRWEGKDYELWMIRGGTPVRATCFTPRAGTVQLKPAHVVVGGVAFGRPYQAPFTVR